MKTNIKKGLENVIGAGLCTALDVPVIKYGIQFSKDILESFNEYDALGKADAIFFTSIAVLSAVASTVSAIHYGKKAYNYFTNKNDLKGVKQK
jgi:hypothetical protein